MAFSPDGSFLAAGENAFKSPEITIWRIEYGKMESYDTAMSLSEDGSSVPATESTERRKNEGQAINYTEIKHLRGHKIGIECLRFAPKNNFLISLGDPQDKGLFVWDWFNEKKLTCNKLGKPALTVAISEEQDFFVTAGH